MRKTGIGLVLAALIAGSLACDSLPFLPFPPTPTTTATPTATLTQTVAPTLTPTPYPTRTSSPTLIPGIEEPVEVGDANLLITKALLRDSFRCENESEPIENPDQEEFLILLMKVVKGPALFPKEILGWVRKNGIHEAEIKTFNRDSIGYSKLCYSQNQDTFILTRIDIGYIVDLDAEWFILILPDGMQIPLDSFFP